MTDKPMYLVRVCAMFAADGADAVVPSAEVIALPDLSNLNVPALAKMLTDSLEGAPLDNLRPMTREEIDAYRRDSDDYDETNLIFDSMDTERLDA